MSFKKTNNRRVLFIAHVIFKDLEMTSDDKTMTHQQLVDIKWKSESHQMTKRSRLKHYQSCGHV